ncbi:MAG: efflux RND transporter periplasmic adaptor subunit [Myxococcales bacterium]|nr:HlyD family efflux transporter periplasmic adaptor subunit [Myxococcales bacterium]
MTYGTAKSAFKFQVLGFMALILTACSVSDWGAEEKSEHARHNDPHMEHSDIVGLEAIDSEEFALEVAAAGPAIIENILALTGEIRPNDDHVAHIVPRYGGIVKRTDKQVGDGVRSGETLAVIESSRSLTPYALKTMIDGVVIEKHVTLGEAVDANTQAFVVADLSTVWVDLDVYIRDLHRVKAGQTVLVEAIHGMPRAEGVISYVAPVVDPKTRTATARVVLENTIGLWHPGMFTVAKVLIGRSEVKSAVPKSAIYSMGNETVVFVVGSHGYKPRPVTLGLRDDYHAEVTGQIKPGENVVVAGGFTVKSELMRAELPDGHGH